VADYMMQGVPVPAGTHIVDLEYRDEPVGIGLVASGVGWGVLGAGLVVAWGRGRRRLGSSSATAEVQ
jgi:hypothetical protein